MTADFDALPHTFSAPNLDSYVEKAIAFFHATPVVRLPLAERFHGAGVYALYYTGHFPFYSKLIKTDAGRYSLPIYVGKAEAKGKRTGITQEPEAENICERLSKHVKSINAASTTLKLEDFRCRFMVMGGKAERDLIVPVEAELIRRYEPLWNRVVHGFGNNPVGGKRLEGAVPKWDILHPGREWASQMIGKRRPLEVIEKEVLKHLEGSDELLKRLKSSGLF